MLGTNKKGTTERINSDKSVYSPFLIDTFQCRYEPMRYTNYNLKAKQISFKFMSDLMDIQLWDRILTDGRKRVAAGVAKYTETLWKHLEVVMREVWPTVVHDTVIKKRLDIVQSGFDPLLQERNASQKEYIEEELLVLLDPREIAKEGIIKMMDAGKIEELDWVMTVDFPDKITKEDRIIFGGDEYEIKRIIPQPYQYQVGLKKSMVNYIDNQDV